MSLGIVQSLVGRVLSGITFGNWVTSGSPSGDWVDSGLLGALGYEYPVTGGSRGPVRK